MSINVINARHLAQDFIIAALIKTLSEEQLKSVTDSVQDSFDETYKRYEGGDPAAIALFDEAKGHASDLLNIEIK